MAGEWIKVELATADKPEVLRMARLLKVDKDLVFGKLIRFWAWFDRNSVDGAVDGVVDGDIDAICMQPGLCAALCSVHWLTIDAAAETVTIPNFDRHNGETAKKRALKNERQARWRGNVDESESRRASTSASTSASTREEKRRSNTPIPPSGAFEQFWQAYPKRKSRADAEKAFAKVNPDEQLLAVMLAAIAKAKTRADWQKEGGQFIPYPASWLNSKGWLDEDSAPAPRRVAI